MCPMMLDLIFINQLGLEYIYTGLFFSAQLP